jgi:hypothetical protein
MIDLLNNINNFDSYRYHIIRLHTGNKFDTTIDTIKSIIEKSSCDKKYDFLKYDMKTIEGINDILQYKPNKHTFIFLREKLRCSITLNKTYLGILYERHVEEFNDTVVIQGLLGRACRYYCLY